MIQLPDAELADLIAARQERDRLRGVLRRVVDIVRRHVPPDGLSAYEAMTEIVGIVDDETI